MLTVRTATRFWTFKPPWAARLFNLVSIGLSEEYDAAKGTLDISLWNLTQKVDVHVTSSQPVKEWQGLYAPMAGWARSLGSFRDLFGHLTDNHVGEVTSMVGLAASRATGIREQLS